MKKIYILLVTLFSTHWQLSAPKLELQTHKFKVDQILGLICTSASQFCADFQLPEINYADIEEVCCATSKMSTDKTFWYPESETLDPDHSYNAESKIRDALIETCGLINQAVVDKKTAEGAICPDCRLVFALFLSYVIEYSKMLEFKTFENPLFIGVCRAMNGVFSRISGGLFCTKFKDSGHDCQMDASCVQRIEPLNGVDSKALILFFDPSKDLDGDPNDCPIENAIWDLQRLFRDWQEEVFDKFCPDKNNQPKL